MNTRTEYRGYLIYGAQESYKPAWARFEWHHSDFDEGDHRCGTSATLEEAKTNIDEQISEAERETESLSQDYLVWSNEHKVWWGPNNAGYCSRLDDAGRYTRDDALKICVRARGGRRYNDNPSEIPILLSDAEVFWPDETEEDRATKHRIREARKDEYYD